MTVQGRDPAGRPKVLRWFVLAIFFGGVALIGFLVTSTAVLGAKVLGSDWSPIDADLAMDFDDGDRIALRSYTDDLFGCTLTPPSGPPKTYQVYGHSAGERGSGSTTNDRAWFTGTAKLHCERPAEIRDPGSFTRDDLLLGATQGGVGAGALCLVAGFVQLYRRTRFPE
ncbi:hypothetical protein [Amycolatopsis sp. CA-230715]|uniref:hypothetical protein n=1 Tax=Amycolatopsis sp. CA-230715 TaxID=2745196 RepID=UPI001C00F4E4|nr:hypothetical protein [Amycolatopsis sp. CA-230715]